eukprot:CCRYP_005327-RB/>CCRYP_005327-RB protein AED:0.29 eAED:0.29 QI:1424/1/1/1/0.25/0.2/5/85/507
MTEASVRSGCSTARSNGSAKYRRVSSTSNVDESLFGSSRCSPNYGKKLRNTKNGGLVSKRVSITASELNRIKESAQAAGEKPKNIASSVCDEKKPKGTNIGAARKEHMKRLEMMEIEKQRNACNEIQSDKFDRIRKKAQEKIDEEEDIVKLLLTCSERAKTFAIRDQQLKDKAERVKQERDYEQRMILAMEIDRLKEIEARGAEEAKKVKKMIEGRKIIEQQIAERHETKLLMEEARDKENREMLEQIKVYQHQDEEKARIRRENAARAREEIIRANEEHIKAKREHRLLEKKEDEMMMAYQMAQDEKLRQREAEDEEADRKKREIQKRLLDEQERTLDRRAEIDELRARRAAEDAERKYRQKQLLEAQKKKQDMEALDMARRQQQQELIDKAQREMAEKQEEYENAIRHAHAMAAREKAEAEQERERITKLITNLQEQIEENRVMKITHEKEKLREGAHIKKKLILEKEKLEATRAKMVEDMKMNGIDERYFGEMVSLDINKFLMK